MTVLTFFALQLVLYNSQPLDSNVQISAHRGTAINDIKEHKIRWSITAKNYKWYTMLGSFSLSLYIFEWTLLIMRLRHTNIHTQEMVINQAERKFDRGVKYFIFRWTIMLVDDDTRLCKTTD